MWNKILIAALVVFLFSAFLFTKTHSSLGGAESEVTEVQKQLQSVSSKAHDIALDERIKVYADLRTEYFNAEQTKFDENRQGIESEVAQLSEEITTAETSLAEAKAEFEKRQEELNDFVKRVSEAAGLDESADGDLESIAAAIDILQTQLTEAKASAVTVESAIADKQKHLSALTSKIAAGRDLHADRQARLSPVELNCRVIQADTNWDYVILDAGLDQGVVIGSRLELTRNGVKICELTVTLVENNRSSCEVVYSTMLPGEAVKTGDVATAQRSK